MSSSERARFEQLYSDYGRLVRNYLFRLGARNQLDDLFQETFIKVWKFHSTIRNAQVEKHWILRIATHQFYDWCRANSVRIEEWSDETAPHSLFGSSTVSQADRLQHLDEASTALQALPAEQRTVSILHYFEEFSTAEIASILEIPEGTVKTRLMKARERMLATLTQKGANHGTSG